MVAANTTRSILSPDYLIAEEINYAIGIINLINFHSLKVFLSRVTCVQGEEGEGRERT